MRGPISASARTHSSQTFIAHPRPRPAGSARTARRKSDPFDPSAQHTAGLPPADRFRPAPSEPHPVHGAGAGGSGDLIATEPPDLPHEAPTYICRTSQWASAVERREVQQPRSLTLAAETMPSTTPADRTSPHGSISTRRRSLVRAQHRRLADLQGFTAPVTSADQGLLPPLSGASACWRFTAAPRSPEQPCPPASMRVPDRGARPSGGGWSRESCGGCSCSRCC